MDTCTATVEDMYPLCTAAGIDGNKFNETHLDQLVTSWGVIVKNKNIRAKQIKFKIMLSKGEAIPHNQAPTCLLLEDLPGERWKPITPRDTTYMISDYGRVKSYKYLNVKYFHAVIVSPEILKSGYYSVDLREFNDTVKHSHFDIHRLVAEAFVPKTEVDIVLNRNIVNHKNGDKLDPYFENLEWVTPRENNCHGIRSSIVKNNNLTEAQLDIIHKLHMSGFTNDEITSIVADADLDSETISKIIRHYDYKSSK